jgi:LSD1 subclass zinc finger protein
MPGLVNYAAAPRSVELREVPTPQIGDKDVLLKVEAVSVCGSDLHQWLGGISWKVLCHSCHEFLALLSGGREVTVSAKSGGQ